MKISVINPTVISLISLCILTGNLQAQDYPLDLKSLTVSGKAGFNVSSGNAIILKAESGDGGLLINDPLFLSKIPESRYLVIGIEHHNPYCGILNYEFYTADPGTGKQASSPRIASKIGILPDLYTYLVFPFSYLDGQEVFLPRAPRQLKGVIFGRRLDPAEIAAIKLVPGPWRSPDFEPEFTIDTLFLTNEIPEYESAPEEKLVDEFGQWNTADWPGKTRSDADFKALSNDMTILAGQEDGFPDELSKYGGWKALRFDPTGFFHTHFDGKRWWFVDPEGYAFLSFGMDCVGASVQGVLGGNEDLYSDLPSADSGYKEAYSDSRKLEMIDYFKVNMIRMFGPDWRSEWEKITRNKLLESGFNTIGNWSDIDFARRSRIPYVLPMSGFPSTEVSLYRDFPDVFSPQYKINAEKFARQLSSFRDDPFLIGYFLRNEPQWAFGDHDLAFEMFATGDMSFSRLAFIKFLENKYGNDVSAFNKAWNLELGVFGDLNLATFKDYPSEESKKDFAEFTGKLVDKYVGTVCEEVKKVDPNHLNLGMRYAYISSDILYRAGGYFDVYSINSYSAPAPAPTGDIFEKTGKPVMIGEFHFGAIDRGLPSTGLRAVASTADRGRAYRCYLEQGFSRPELIGIHYFQWMDQPVAGRFDGENYNIGFNDILYRGYPELEEAALKSHKRIYNVAAGRKKAYRHKIKDIPTIAF